MHMLQFHAGANNTQQERFREIAEIFKLSDYCFRIKTIANNGRMLYTFVYPFCKWLDNTPDLLAFDDGKVYSEKDLYNFCSNWITEDILNVLEVPNG